MTPALPRLALSALLLLSLFACGGGGTASPTASGAGTPATVSLSLSPTSAALVAGASQAFTATVTGSANTSVTWTADGGSITTAGVYTAPAIAGTYHVTATSAADGTKSAMATVTVTAASTSTLLTDFAPSSGGPGSTVTLMGSGLAGASAVAFNGVAATAISENSDTRLKVVVPPGASSGRISVTTPKGSALSTADFALIQATSRSADLFVAANGSGDGSSITKPCSLASAQAKVRTLNASLSKDLVVQLAGGLYTLTDTWKLQAADSGSNGHKVIWQAAPGETVRISGGKRITGWKPGTGGIWTAAVGNLAFRSLFVEGRPAIRARDINDGFHRVKHWNLTDKTFEVDPAETSAWARLGQVEAVVLRHWNQHRYRLQGFGSRQGELNLALGAKASASSSDDVANPPGKATDGDVATAWTSKSGETGAWWEVNLGGALRLKRIELVTRQDADLDWSRRNFEVWASNHSNMSLGKVVLASVGATALPFKGTWTLNVTDTTPYGYLAVVTKGGSQLSFAEFRAFDMGDPVSVVSVQNPERDLGVAAANPEAVGGQAYRFENALEFLDAPGEFYLDRDSSTLSYLPRAGENLDSAEVFAPALQTLLDLSGVKSVRFEGLIFEHADWLEPDTKGFVGNQAGKIVGGSGNVPAGVRVQDSQSVDFVRNAFRLMGASGLNVYKNSQNLLIQGNAFFDLGGGGISLDANAEPSASACTVLNTTVSDNRVARIGQQFTGSVGIWAAYVENALIEHNRISDCPYTGISLGWGWSATETRIKNNTVRANLMERVMNLHDDGAGIYSLSNQPGTVIEKNVVRDVVRSPWAGDSPVVGLYLDQGSTNVTLRDNVLVNVPAALNLNKTGTNVITNNDGNSATTLSEAGPRAGW